MFPIVASKLRPLYGYNISAGTDSLSELGGKLSYRTRREFGGHWVWDGKSLITDRPQDEEHLSNFVSELWDDEPSSFSQLIGVKTNAEWKASSASQAAFVARGLVPDFSGTIRKSILSAKRQDIGAAYVDRLCSVRDWVVQGIPSISVSISSRVFHKEDLSSYAARVPDLQELIGLEVADKNSDLVGEISEVVGSLEQHRQRLVAVTKVEETRRNLMQAPDDMPVLKVRTRNKAYDYAASSLRLVVRSDYYGRFGIDAVRARKAMIMAPEARFRLVMEVAKLLRDNGLIGFAFSSTSSPALFAKSADFKLDSTLRFGGDSVATADRYLMTSLRKYGIYRQHQRFRDRPIRIGVVDTSAATMPREFIKRFEDALRSLGFGLEIVGSEKPSSTDRVQLETAVNTLSRLNPDILLGLFRNEVRGNRNLYWDFKSLTINRGAASQVVYERTLTKDFALDNIVLGVLAKTGNIPFVLAKPLPYADIVVGIDIARERKKKLGGSINVAAVARIYFSNGEFVRYVIHDEPLEGETIPVSVIERMFPKAEFQGKRVVVHRDGWFRGDERRALTEWGEKIHSEVYPVDVVKSGSPRLYSLSAEGGTQLVSQPTKGDALKAGRDVTLLVSTLPPFRDATPQPLQVRSSSGLSMEQAVHSVLALTLLHYGSVRPPRLPVTTHYGDKIAGLALKGVKPKNLEGNIPFWL